MNPWALHPPMILRQLKTGRMANFTYIIGDEGSGEAAVVDPHAEIDRVLAEADRQGLRVKLVLNTHGHWDHTAGNAEVVRRTGAKVAAHHLAPGAKDIPLGDGEILRIGGTEIRVLHTPGHTPDSVCFLVGGALLTGDTLFIGECGRTDLPGGDPGAMYESLLIKIRSLPDDLMVYPGHDYGAVPSATLGEEKRGNYTLQPRSREEFIRFMRTP